MAKLREFDNHEEAFHWLHKVVDDGCIDNDRFYFYGDKLAEAYFEECAEHGCCGSMEKDVIIAGRAARIGCNYGH